MILAPASFASLASSCSSITDIPMRVKAFYGLAIALAALQMNKVPSSAEWKTIASVTRRMLACVSRMPIPAEMTEIPAAMRIVGAVVRTVCTLSNELPTSAPDPIPRTSSMLSRLLLAASNYGTRFTRDHHWKHREPVDLAAPTFNIVPLAKVVTAAHEYVGWSGGTDRRVQVSVRPRSLKGFRFGWRALVRVRSEHSMHSSPNDMEETCGGISYAHAYAWLVPCKDYGLARDVALASMAHFTTGTDQTVPDHRIQQAFSSLRTESPACMCAGRVMQLCDEDWSFLANHASTIPPHARHPVRDTAFDAVRIGICGDQQQQDAALRQLRPRSNATKPESIQIPHGIQITIVGVEWQAEVALEV